MDEGLIVTSREVNWAEFDDRIIAAFKANMKVSHIGQDVGLAASTVNKRLFQLKLKTTSQKDSWLPEHVAILKAEWEKGTVAPIIGEMIGKTRNAVLGKVHRLGLEHRAPRNGSMVRASNKRGPSKPPARRNPVVKNPKSTPPKFYDADRPLTKKPPISIMELDDNTCRAVVGHGQNGLAVYCGDMPFPGQVWCPAHCAIYFVPPKERRGYR